MKVSIITVCFNSEKTIEKTIVSVLAQKNTEIEYIVIDGGSTDQTIKIINKHKQYIDIFLSESDLGIFDAINKGIIRASGEVISILHSDDIYFDQYAISNVTSYFNKQPSLECLIGNTLITKKNSNKIKRKYSSKIFKKWMLYFGFSPPHPSTFVRKEIYKTLGLYSTDFKIAGDFDFYLKIMLKNSVKFLTVDEDYVIMKSGGVSSYSLKSNYHSTKEIIQSFKKNKLYSNFFLVMLRFPFKLIQYLIK